MGHNGEKFVNAWPWYGPWRSSLSQSEEVSIGPFVPRGIFAVGIHENIAIDGDHPPRPS